MWAALLYLKKKKKKMPALMSKKSSRNGDADLQRTENRSKVIEEEEKWTILATLKIQG